MKTSFFFILLLLAASSFKVFGQDDLIKPKQILDQYGKYEKCDKKQKGAAYAVSYKNENSFPIDLVIALKAEWGEWIVFREDNIAPQDTMSAYVCTSGGVVKTDFREGDSDFPLKTYEDYNEEWLKNHPDSAKRNLIRMEAKLLVGSDNLSAEPLSNQKVSLKNANGRTLQSTQTDEFGDFMFENVNSKLALKFALDDKPSVNENEKVYLASRKGEVISEIEEDEDEGFQFRLLPNEISKMTVQEVIDDPMLALQDFVNFDEQNIVIVDKVYFKPSSKDLTADAKQKLDNVIDVMKESKGLHVRLEAHSDSKGDDAFNLKLSDERAQEAVKYMVASGIDASRVSGKGFGETKLLNRCKNGVNCSEIEHSLNRRIEFNFSK